VVVLLCVCDLGSRGGILAVQWSVTVLPLPCPSCLHEAVGRAAQSPWIIGKDAYDRPAG
jgi:hypothetical protein